MKDGICKTAIAHFLQSQGFEMTGWGPELATYDKDGMERFFMDINGASMQIRTVKAYLFKIGNTFAEFESYCLINKLDIYC